MAIIIRHYDYTSDYYRLGIFFFITCILPIVLIVYSIKKSKKHDMDYFGNMLFFATLNNF